MADNMSVSNPSIPLFKGENYEFWSIKMVTLFKSLGLWDLVNNGVPDLDPNHQENEKEDARALFYIQLAVMTPSSPKLQQPPMQRRHGQP
jgi:hypothetical protein